MKAIGYRVIAENMIVAQVDTKREAQEIIREAHRCVAIMGEPKGSFTIEAVR